MSVLLPLLFIAFGAHAAGGDNPHWKAGSCTTCHNSDSPTAEALDLKTTPGYAVCSDCHDGMDAAVCRHRSDIVVTDERLADIDDLFKVGVTDGQVGCTTCHEMKPHCALDTKQRYRNPTFLRGAPYDYNGDQCFGCHENSYRQPSPHRQGRGTKFKEDLCIFCHEVVPETNDAGEWMPVQFATDQSLSKLCSGCHAVGPHPASSVSGKTGWIHLLKPAEKYATKMEETISQYGGRLPLDPKTGQLTCATCHDPHDGRLSGFSKAETPGEDAKLRYDDICGACHDY